MIFYDSLQEKNFAELGIPMEQRGRKCYDALVSNYGENIFYPLDSNVVQLCKNDYLRAHSQEYIDKIFSDKIIEEIYKAYELDKYGKVQMDLIGFGIKVLAQTAVSATAMHVCLTHGWSYFLGGGMHHAHNDFGHGFCLVNDIVIGIRKLQVEGVIKNAWVIDVDAHKGDGTAAITNDDDSIKTLSIHMAKGWPIEDGDIYPSSIDIPIGQNEESYYLSRLQQGLGQIGKCDLAVIVNGSDPYKLDALPSTTSMKLSKKQMLERDQMIYHHFKNAGIPQCYLFGGGYGPHSWKIHFQFLDYLVGMS